MVCLACHPPERKAQQPLFVFLPVYPELVGVVGSRVPDYRGRFLRGLQSGHSVGQTVANSLKSHNHTQPTHTHSFSGQLVSTAISGTASGQRFQDRHTGISNSPNHYDSWSGAVVSPLVRSVGGEGVSSSTAYAVGDATYHYAESSSVSGSVKNGTVRGSIGQGGGDPTNYTRPTETAPDHIYVRCLIRAKP